LKLGWLELAFALSFMQTFGWIYFDGRKRRSHKYRDKVMEGLSRLPMPQRDRFATLFYPRTMQERWVQAMVIGTCSLVLAIPFYLPPAWYYTSMPWASLGTIILASYLAAVLGEFLLNW
jgi:hypothetical protein